MGVERPMLGFLGERGETMAAVLGGAVIGFFSGGIAGATTTALGFSTYISYRWSLFNQEEALRRKHALTVQLCATGFFALLSGVAVNFFDFRRRDVCVADPETVSCKVFWGLEITCVVSCIIFTSAVIYHWQKEKEERKTSWFF